MDFVRRKRKSLSKEIVYGIKYLHFAFILIIVIATVAFLYNLSQSAYLGYQVRQYEINYHENETSNHRLKIQSLEAKSFVEIEKLIENEAMVQPENTTYVEPRLKRLTRTDF